jgi:predicted DNA-binding transcriptional regulator YafY
MNKLDIALKLLRLLNERRCLDSRIVAGELNVSLRTAQRYLLELSGLPCVITDEKEHTYSLNSDYPLKDALLKGVDSDALRREIEKGVRAALALREITCSVCGNTMKNLL